jgi:hypothetical protein
MIVPDGPTQRELSEAGNARIRDTTKWLIGAYAAVGAALIAGSQLSNIGRLEACLGCGRLWLSITGVALGLSGVAYSVHAGVQVLVWQNKPASDLQVAWERGEKSAVFRFFRANQVFLQGFRDFRDLAQQEMEVLQTYDDVERELKAASQSDKPQLQLRLGEVDSAVRDLLARSEAVVSLANQVELADFFTRATLRRLLIGAVAVAVGIGLFAWAANPPPGP